MPMPRPPRTVLLVSLLAAASMATTLLVALWAYGQARQAGLPDDATASPPVLFDVPPFALTERSGQTVTRDDLEGNVWIGQFTFTRCAGPCPIITARTASLQDILKQHSRWSDMRLVSFSVDPEHDTPAVLRRYATTAGATDHWLFLTGEREQVWTLIKDGFKLPVQEQDDPAMPILHSSKRVLVDAQGRIRGYYSAVDDEGRAALLRDLGRVLAEMK